MENISLATFYACHGGHSSVRECGALKVTIRHVENDCSNVLFFRGYLSPPFAEVNLGWK